MLRVDVRRPVGLTAALLLAGLCCVLGSGAAASSGPHTPEFTYDETRHGVFDHGTRIVKIQSWKIEQSAAAFDDVVLQPGRPPAIASIPCHWTTQSKLEGLEVDVAGQGTDRLVLTFRAEEEKGRYLDERTATITYDPAIDSYVYLFEARFTVTLGSTYAAAHLEFLDPHWIHLGHPGPSIPRDAIEAISGGEAVWPIAKPAGEWRPLFQFYAYEAADGNIYKIHLNHRIGRRTQRSLPLKKDAVLAAVYNPERGNPAFQLIGDTGPRTDIEACHWGYDSHLRLRLSESGDEVTLYGGDSIAATVKVFRLPDAKALELMQRAQPRPMPPQEILRSLRPAFHLLSSFEESSDPYRTGGDVDPGYWDVFNPERKPWSFLSTAGPIWSTNMGRDDDYCVGSVHRRAGVSGWSATTGVSQWTGAAPPRDKVWKITAFLKTREVAGKGAFIQLEQKPLETRESEALTGNRSWTEVSVLAPPGWGGKGNAFIRLLLDGTGYAWFDDVKLELVDHEWPAGE